MHRRVVITRRHAFDVVATIVGFERAFRAKDYAGGHRSLTTGVTDVIALQTLRWLVQTQYFSQRLEPRSNMLAVGQTGAQCLFGVSHGQLLPACPRTTNPMTDGQ